MSTASHLKLGATNLDPCTARALEDPTEGSPGSEINHVRGLHPVNGNEQ